MTLNLQSGINLIQSKDLDTHVGVPIIMFMFMEDSNMKFQIFH